MNKKIKPEQPEPIVVEKKAAPRVFMPALLGSLALAVLYFVLSYTGVFDANKKTTESLLSSYQLYSPGDASKTAMLFFGAVDSDCFKLAAAEIYESDLQINRIKQLLITLMQGPQDNTLVNLLPEGTALIDAYLDANSILYIDLSPEFAANCKGGTTGEYQALYSILNTVFYNFPFVMGAKIAINGAEKDTLAGHISIKSILTRDTDLSKYGK